MIIIWHVWYAQNKVIFEDSFIPPKFYRIKSLTIHSLFPLHNDHNKLWIIKDLNIDRSQSRTFFDGASQRNPSKGGVGGIIFFNDTH